VFQEQLALFAFTEELTLKRGEQFRLDGELAIPYWTTMLSQVL
jgi:hypothetical protein